MKINLYKSYLYELSRESEQILNKIIPLHTFIRFLFIETWEKVSETVENLHATKESLYRHLICDKSQLLSIRYHTEKFETS